ncbi:CPBP family intramembrane glutamic endopeptidase [Segetibacter koreensis]|uniref:CPBP family intramembrane glutamic endopeptidase n=1 Tax=Segetibacter koreensis TaxID=398037 RepID=UPI00035D180D|nr:CPBP family intramembrane glutamic endopeptidase [Segetibacter koreensis]
MNTYLKYQPPAIQFLVFLALAGGFFLVDYAISSFFFNDISSVLLDKNTIVSTAIINKFKWAQLTGSIISFIFPALFFGYYSSPKALPYIGIQKSVTPVLFFASVALLFCIQPFIGWLGEINAHTKFGSLQKTLEEMEAVYNRALKVFLQMKTFKDLLINLFIMALLPAIGEELFFRGSLQKALLRMSQKPWLAILVSSLVFGLLHGTFFKLLPIFTLGLLLGTVYHVTRNLWYTITIHFINNAFAVLSVYYADSSSLLKRLAGDDISVPLYGALLSGVIGVGIIFFIKRKSDEDFPEIVTNDENDYIA